MKENKMKPKRIQRYDGPSWQGRGNTGGDKTTLNQATAVVHSSAPVKPFAGKVFYLDLPSNKLVETLERDIKELGGTVEKFFSKEIKYLVSNKREAKYVQCLRQDSPIPSPDSGQSSPQPRSNPHHPGSHGDNMKSRSQGQTEAFVSSRGKSLVERVVKEQKRVHMNKILSNALEWGVKILYIDDVMAYVQKKKKNNSGHCPITSAKTNVKTQPAAKQSLQKCKGGRISKPFVKVEDSSRHYRPIILNMPNMPELNLKTVPPCSPFCFEDKDNPGNRQRGHRGAKASASEERLHGRKKNKDKKRGGYCECCMVKYENLTTHLQSDRHKAFSKSEEYFVVDRLVSTMHCNFIHIKSKVKRPKCSVSSVLIAPGPCGKTEIRHRGDLNTTETTKEEQLQTVDGQCGECYSGHDLKISSLHGSAPLIQREDDNRNVFSASDRSEHKSLTRKRLCRKNSLTSFTRKKEQAESSQKNMETAPSRGECFSSFASRVAQLDVKGQISHTDMNSSASLLHTIDTQNELPSGCLNDTANHQEQSDMNKDSLLLEAVLEGNLSPKKVTGNNLSDKAERCPPTQICSPARKVQRRVRVYKRKRRKLDTHVTCQEHQKPKNEICDDSLLTLWELFQSSDDVDVEFLGFED